MKAATATRPRKKRSRAPAKNGPNPVDVHVGARVRLRRTLVGMSQDKLGQALGLTFQQVQKYERGSNRIGSSRLYQLGQILDVPVSHFFDEMPDDIAASQRGHGFGKRIVLAAMALSRQHGAGIIYLLTESAQTFFERLGFISLPRNAVPASVQASLEFTIACPGTVQSMVLQESG